MIEKTFANFTPSQASSYAADRGMSYPSPLYDTVISYAQQSRTQPSEDAFDLLLDVGTGPGKVVHDLLPHFKRAIGTDNGTAMIEAAKQDARYDQMTGTAGGKEVRFDVCPAEKIASLKDVEGKVDVVTAAMAAHWFEIAAFYEQAAKVLKPGGTLAMWTCASMYAHPADPHHKELQAILSHLEDDILAPYVVPGNISSRDRYRNLPLPWTLSERNVAFEEASFRRCDWDEDGVPSAPSLEDGTPGPFLLTQEIRPVEFGRALGSSSMVVRWREAHKDQLDRGEVEDCVALTARKLQDVLKDRASGKFVAGPTYTLLLMRRV